MALNSERCWGALGPAQTLCIPLHAWPRCIGEPVYAACCAGLCSLPYACLGLLQCVTLTILPVTWYITHVPACMSDMHCQYNRSLSSMIGKHVCIFGTV